jgi:hypothetical protein
MAAVYPSEIPICIAATFKVPNGREPRKLMNMPVKKIFAKGCIGRKYQKRRKLIQCLTISGDNE